MNTGLYTMFYIKYFDGEVITMVLTKVTSIKHEKKPWFEFVKVKIIVNRVNFQEATQLQRVNLMYQLLKMDGNIGKPPQSILMQWTIARHKQLSADAFR